MLDQLSFLTGVIATGVVVRDGFKAGAVLSGAPTEISQRWPGCPCAGFIPAATVVTGVVIIAGAVTVGAELITTGLWFAGIVVDIAGVVAGVLLAAPFKGAPTEISQRWPGSPCAGFKPVATVVVGGF